MMRKRKVRKIRVIILAVICVAIMSLSILLITLGINLYHNMTFDADKLNINELDYSDVKELDIDLYSKGYMLIRLNDYKVLYGKDYDEKFYPASLAKVMTMDSVLHICDDINETSSLTYEQNQDLITENASLAYLQTDKEYSINDLLYALILPSGADAATALSNYANLKGANLVDEMNLLCSELNLSNTSFTNTTGLHDGELYTTLNDYAKIVIDTLNNSTGKAVLKSMNYKLSDGTIVYSSLIKLSENNNVLTYGGKTGYTDEAGMNICVLYQYNNRSYLLILRNAEGNPYIDQKHIKDVNKIYEYLYN